MTKTELLNLIANNLPTNGAGEINASDLRGVLNELVNTLFESKGIDLSATDPILTPDTFVDGRAVYQARAKVTGLTDDSVTYLTDYFLFSNIPTENSLPTPSDIRNVVSAYVTVEYNSVPYNVVNTFPLGIQLDKDLGRFYIDTGNMSVLRNIFSDETVSAAWFVLRYTLN